MASSDYEHIENGAEYVRITAIKMLKQGLNLKLIAEVTGLSFNEIQKLRAML